MNEQNPSHGYRSAGGRPGGRGRPAEDLIASEASLSRPGNNAQSRSNRVTIRDVGVAAGVSTATVSRVLNGKGSVDPALTERVLNAVHELDYRPNATAQGLARGSSGAIGVLVPDLANPYFPEILKAVSSVARGYGRRVMVMESEEDPEVEPELAEDLMRSCDGLLLCSPRMARSDLVDLAARDLPIVLVNRVVAGLDAPSVSMDFFGGMSLVCGHLVQLGHRRVAYLSGPETSWANSERIRALEAAKAFGLEVTITLCGSTSSDGYNAVPSVLDSDVTAIATYNDLVAIGAQTRLRELGVAIPEQISLIGFDDIWLDRFAYSRLTTVSVPRGRLGHLAGDMLEQLMSTGHDSEPRYIPTELLVRETSAPPKHGERPEQSSQSIDLTYP